MSQGVRIGIVRCVDASLEALMKYYLAARAYFRKAHGDKAFDKAVEDWVMHSEADGSLGVKG